MKKKNLSVFIRCISGNAGRRVVETGRDSTRGENGRFSIALFCDGKENA